MTKIKPRTSATFGGETHQTTFEEWIKAQRDTTKQRCDKFLTTSIDEDQTKGSIWILKGKDKLLTTESKTAFYLIEFGARLFT